MVILPGIRVIVRRFLCIERRFLSDWSKKFYVDVLAQCVLWRCKKSTVENAKYSTKSIINLQDKLFVLPLMVGSRGSTSNTHNATVDF